MLTTVVEELAAESTQGRGLQRVELEVESGIMTMPEKALALASTPGTGSAVDGAYQKNGSVTSDTDPVDSSPSSDEKRPTTSAGHGYGPGEAAGEVTATPELAGNTMVSEVTVGTTTTTTACGKALERLVPPAPPLLPLTPRDLNVGSQRNTLDNDDVHKSAPARKVGGYFGQKALKLSGTEENHGTDEHGHGHNQEHGHQHQPTRIKKVWKASNLKSPLPSLLPLPSHQIQSQPPPGTPGIEKTLRLLDKAERRRRDKEKDEQKKEVAIWASKVARVGAETDRILAEKQTKTANRQLGLKLKQFSSAPSSPKPRSPVLEKLSVSFLGWGRKASSSSLREPFTPNSSTAVSIDLNDASGSAAESMSRTFITPQVDAPKGASNGADRRVTVRCKGTKTELDVKNEMSTVDILVAFCEHDAITVNASLLVESYGSLGLQRRLRRYERIWNVMNSWDGDSSNSLMIWPDALKSIDKDLDLANVSRQQPSGFVLSLYHSHRPGKWSKRFIILQEGGQLVSSKNAEPSPSDKDVVNLCHVSDYDIYTPTEEQMRAQKFPRKYCYAVKSQQKRNIFVNSDKYVHYFCTSDPTVAEKFHAYIHSWRSWYMVHKMLQLHQKKAREAEKPPQIPLEDPTKYTPKKGVGHVKVQGHKVRVSVDESPYTIGAFAPLIDTRRFNKPLDEFGKDWEADDRRQSHSASHEKTRPAEPKPLVDLKPPDTFAATGLLGKSYNQRKQSQKEDPRQRQTSQGSSGSSFAEAPTLLNGGLTGGTNEVPSPDKKSENCGSSSWFPSALEHTAKQRTERPSRPSISSGASSQYDQDRRGRTQRRPTIGQQPQPLVNFTPTFVEAPQWSRDGRGRGIRAPEGKPLVDFATGPVLQPHSRFAPPAPPRNLIRRESQREAPSQSQYRPSQRRATDSDGRQQTPPSGSYSSFPTRRPTVTSTTSASVRRGYNLPSPVSPTSPTGESAPSRPESKGENEIPLPRSMPRMERDVDRDADRPSTGSSIGTGGTYGYSQGSGGQSYGGRMRAYSRSAAGQQPPPVPQGQGPPRYLSSREPRTAVAGGGGLALVQKQGGRERAGANTGGGSVSMPAPVSVPVHVRSGTGNAGGAGGAYTRGRRDDYDD